MIENYIFILPFLFHVLYVYMHLKNTKMHKTERRKPLKDIIMDNGPDLRNIKFIMDPLLIIFLLPYLINNKTRYLIDNLKLFSLIFGLRIITSTITEVPSSDPDCETNKLGIFKYLSGHCFDKIFSGHTSLTLLLVLIAYDKSLLSFKKYLIYQILQIMYAFMLVFTRGHYSVDVVLAYIIVIPIFFLLKDKLN